MQQTRLFLLFTEPLNRLGLQYMVTGAVASIIYGEPRTTHDIDLVVDLDDPDAAKVTNAFPSDEFYCPAGATIRAESTRGERGHFNVIHHATGFKADIYIKGDHPMHEWTFQHR